MDFGDGEQLLFDQPVGVRLSKAKKHPHLTDGHARCFTFLTHLPDLLCRYWLLPAVIISNSGPEIKDVAGPDDILDKSL